MSPFRVSEIGTQQLSINTDSVRRLLLEFPKAARPLDDPSEFASYAHHVEREMGAAINLVKVMQVCGDRLLVSMAVKWPTAFQSSKSCWVMWHE